METLIHSAGSSIEKRTAPVVLLLIGPPGCGKGTQAQKLKKALEIPSISTGEMIRAEISAQTPLGKLAQGITITGGLIGDDIINEMVASRLARPDCANGFLLDGYPRSVPQAEFLKRLLDRMGFPQPTVLHLDVAFTYLIERTCERRFCPACGQNYNLKSQPPKNANLCDHCGTALNQRADDCEESVKNRLDAYQKTTAPLIDYYSRGSYYCVDASGSPSDVFQQVFRKISTSKLS